MVVITEKNLCENIPYDLAKAYRRARRNVTQSDSQRHPQTRHGELDNADSRRRQITYDYGKADYEEITPEEAVDLVKRDKHNIESFRIIYKGDLVEYEVRDNGSIYCIYSNRDNSFTSQDGKYYKNIAFAPYKKVLEVADKIYKTNEYDLLISGEEQQKRMDRDTLYPIGQLSKPTPETRFRPGKGFYDDARLQIRQLDTGAHTPTDSTSRYFRMEDPENEGSYLNAGSDKYMKQSLYSKYRTYLEFLNKKKDRKNRLRIITNTLNKLEKDKEEYTEDEYNELKARLTDRKKTAEANYKEVLDQIALGYRDIVDSFNFEIAGLNRKLGRYLVKIENLIQSSQQLKSDIDKKLNEPSSLNYDGRYALQATLKKLPDIIQQLKSLEKEASGYTVDELEDKRSEITGNMDKLIDNLKKLRKNSFEQMTQSLHSAEEKLAAMQQEYDAIQNEIRPQSQAKKARQAAKDKKELDPALSDIIEFE